MRTFTSCTEFSEKGESRDCFNLTLGAGTVKGINNGLMNFKITDGAGYNVNVFRKAIE